MSPDRHVVSRAVVLLAVLALPLALACGSESVVPTGTGPGPDPGPDNDVPSASISSPPQDATFAAGEMIDFEGSGSDTEDGTLSGGALEWASDVDGALGTGATVSRDDLSEGEHTVTLTATDGDGATATDQVQITVGQGGGSPSTSVVPLEEGRRWRYAVGSETTVCGGSTGCDTDNFSGRYFVEVEGQATVGGRGAWAVRIHTLQDGALDGDYAYDTFLTHLSQDAGGLSQWIDGPAVWRQVLSTASASFEDGTFFLVNGPPRDPDRRLVQSESSVAVPFGAFSTVAVSHDYRETGEFATEDVFDSAVEHYAPQVGMVRGSWDYSFDDNDPAGTDVFTTGAIEMTHMDTGPFPDRPVEAEPNDGPSSATGASGFSISEGDVQGGDPGTVLTDAEVGCTISECVHPDADGDKVVQDWFRVELGAETDIRIVLDFRMQAQMTPTFNDLDLYLFEDDGAGGITYLASAAGPAGEREQLTGTLAAGTYYLGIQAWETPGGRTPFWLAVW